MNKKPRTYQRKLNIIFSTALAILFLYAGIMTYIAIEAYKGLSSADHGIASAVFNLWTKGSPVETDSDSEAAKAEAIRQAKEFQCSGFAATVITPAIHPATGASYNFPSSCLPPGWERMNQLR